MACLTPSAPIFKAYYHSSKTLSLLTTDDSDVQAQSSLDSTLVPRGTAESTEETCSVDPGGSYRDKVFKYGFILARIFSSG